MNRILDFFRKTLPEQFGKLTSIDKWHFLEVYALVTAIIFIFLMVRHALEPKAAPVAVAVQATPAPMVKDKPKVDIPLKKGTIKAYRHQDHIKAQIQLPPMVIADPTQQVIAASKVEPDDHAHTISTVINSETGESVTYDTKEPLPWLAWDNRGEAGIYAGIKNGTPAIRLEVKEGLFAVKAIHFGLQGTVDQSTNGQTDIFVGVGGAYRW